ncbi:MAG: hypothetical protein A2848_00740 [Candidatus Magasanikbacteria bacterium RIFCSPHIGHO2_01_FULL_50_8]|uniref:50S ribosomal protein L28 n=2 Tax=Candidatus Magasanikiibacteriota TaxID=1752731 RepID=A0A1F6LPH5_9BACT|nr:MAG: hypothetical protein A2848_00740 [Candidatus Magasanikbacteria bacterium RIFCSPHIGHO2_01_FULL_50_8]OGH68008.1 MAG: hypothetical protein A3C15_04115 [Candidatus Magasanikbacteria bacterium RIFCSPHIGHO2_02_FULL_50_9b]
MAQICKLCTRGPVRSATRSHSNIQSKKWSNINLQPRRLMGSRVLICSKCWKTVNKLVKA